LEAPQKIPSEATALRASLAGTIVPIATGFIIKSLENPNSNHAVPAALILTGLTIGPATGYFYGGCHKRGLKGIGIRALTIGGTTALAYALIKKSQEADKESNEMFAGAGEALFAIAVIGVGSIALITEDIIDLARVKSSVQKHNELLFSKSITLEPIFLAKYNAPGIAMRVTF
jgi:hypothetical protein